MFEANGGFSRGLTRIELPADARRPLHGQPAPADRLGGERGLGLQLRSAASAALALGGFDEALDLGAELPGGGDHDLLGARCRQDIRWSTSRRHSPGTSTVPEADAVPRPGGRSSAGALRIPRQASVRRRTKAGGFPSLDIWRGG